MNIYFFTATILEWKKLLMGDDYKDIIIKSLKFLVEDKRIKVHAFVIMPNHIHLIWKILEPHILSDVQRDFLKFTAQKFKFKLSDESSPKLNEYFAGARDREYQFWERNPLSVELISLPVLEQKINYIHANPIQPKWNLAEKIADYKYSSAKFYYEGIDEFGFLSHYLEE